MSSPTYDTSVSDWRTGPADRVGTSLEAAQGRIGLSYVYWPDYLGADTGDYRAALMVDMTFGAGGFLNNDDGLGWRLVTLNGLEAKVSLNWHEAQVFTGRTQGIHDIGNRTHFEADVTFTDLGMTYELEYSKPLSGFDGWTLTAAISSEVPMQTGTLTTRFGLTHGSRDWMRSYYGIDAQESAASGLAEYTPGAGLRDVFFEATVDIPVAAQYGFEVSGGVRRMLGPASNAPQVRDVGSPTDYTLGATFYYRF